MMLRRRVIVVRKDAAQNSSDRGSKQSAVSEKFQPKFESHPHIFGRTQMQKWPPTPVHVTHPVKEALKCINHIFAGLYANGRERVRAAAKLLVCFGVVGQQAIAETTDAQKKRRGGEVSQQSV